MNSKHLTKGDACPSIVAGKLRIYSMRFCPYAQRALLVAAAKKIPYDVVNVNLTQKPEFIFDKNPGGKVPTIETPKGSLYESLIVCDFMDEAYPDSGPSGDASNTNGDKLNSIDPFQKALDRIWIENFSKIATLDYKAFYPAPDASEESVIALLTELYENLATFDKELVSRGTKFFGGNVKPGMLDYMIWPWVERFPTHELLYNDKFDFNRANKRLETFTRWCEMMRKDPAVIESYCTPEVHMKYRMSRKQGTVNYDLLLKN